MIQDLLRMDIATRALTNAHSWDMLAGIACGKFLAAPDWDFAPSSILPVRRNDRLLFSLFIDLDFFSSSNRFDYNLLISHALSLKFDSPKESISSSR